MSVPVPPLARSALDRDAESRTAPDLFDRLDAADDVRVLPIWRGRALMAERVDGSAPELALLPPGEVPASGIRIYLGRTVSADGGPSLRIVARVLDDDDAHGLEPEEARWAGLRTVVTGLADRDAGLFTEAVALANWHESHRHCPACGAPSTPEQGGWVRRCTVEDRQIFPRTDPAVIVLVTDDRGRVLLGSNAMWEQHRFSVLAGFVEPGESLEAAVVREIEEEAGLAVSDVRYLGSQPWPFPASLMVGFAASVEDPDAVRPDGEEIVELRWYTREALADAAGEIALPGASSIARWMLEQWYGGDIDGHA
ncbi:NTP pyrophosphohydrolase [Agromyces rhizosphaerae]|uniref:NAD(+) diphosphatase n=1 Tax=Agromyces rhizosphaerae TaxID=88374 RepID=A0A9W6FQE2_9MICO|nr:NAD(+) diphosphatase [Agromyces rhizosphaerae]GLI28440.1 NTP pyrophosphohydrolase [Agromyces rhizosphaerae]